LEQKFSQLCGQLHGSELSCNNEYSVIIMIIYSVILVTPSVNISLVKRVIKIIITSNSLKAFHVRLRGRKLYNKILR